MDSKQEEQEKELQDQVSEMTYLDSKSHEYETTIMELKVHCSRKSN